MLRQAYALDVLEIGTELHDIELRADGMLTCITVCCLHSSKLFQNLTTMRSGL